LSEGENSVQIGPNIFSVWQP